MDFRKQWELAYIIMDFIGIGLFFTLAVVMCPRGSKLNHDQLSLALMKVCLCIVFCWLCIADLGGILDLPMDNYIGSFPMRGVGLRMLLITPGCLLYYRFVR